MTADGTYNYTWNGENRLSTAAGVTYTYDGDGRRVKKSTGTLYWYGMSGVPLAETDLSGNTVNEYILFARGRIARRDSAGNVYYYFGDHLGSSRSITNATGTICYEADFYPFGGERVISNTCGQNYKFAGMQRDSETGNDQTWFRYYASNLGRWFSPDPVAGSIFDPQSLNRYAYVLNNPMNFIDPLGLQGLDREERLDRTIERIAGLEIRGGGLGGGSCYMDGIRTSCNVVFQVLNAGSGGTTVRSVGGVITISGRVQTGWNYNVVAWIPGTDIPVYTLSPAYSLLIIQLGFDPVGYYNDYLRRRRQARIDAINRVPSSEEYIQAIAAAAPSVCGGGVFGYAGVARERRGVGGFLGGLAEYDTRAGGSMYFLGEAGSERGAGGLAVNSNQAIPLLFLPVHPSGGLVLFDSGAGFYVGTPAVGGGVYLNVTTNAGCR